MFWLSAYAHNKAGGGRGHCRGGGRLIQTVNRALFTVYVTTRLAERSRFGSAGRAATRR